VSTDRENTKLNFYSINLIIYYAPYILVTQFHRTQRVAMILGASNASTYFAFGMLAVLVIERFGRRSLMMFGSTGMGLCMVLLAVLTGAGGLGEGIAGIVFMFLFTGFFAFGWLGIGWLYPAEIVPLRVRGASNALACSANWLFNFMVVMITPVVFSRIGYKSWIIWAAM
jgi:Sugar (and other) transporter